MHDSALKQALGYRRFTGTPRILVFDSGYFIVRDVLEAAAELGYAVTTLPVGCGGPGAGRFVADLLTAVCAHRPDFLLTINHLGLDEQGVLAGLLARFEVPLASWFVDHPLPILGGAAGNATPQSQVFCLERTALPWLRSCGFIDPVHLPTAASKSCAAQQGPAAPAPQRAPVCFVGDSWYRKGFVEPPAWAQAAAERLRQRHRLDKALVAAGLEPALDEVAGELPAGRARYVVAGAALAQAACAERVELARALAPLGLRVHGDEHWARLVPGLDLRPPLAAPAAFAAAEVNVNLTAVQMPTSLNQRVWEVPAAGEFLLTDQQEDLALCFRDNEVATYAGVADLQDRARFYLAHPLLRQEISMRARARVEAEHGYRHRLLRMIDVMRARFA